MPEAEFRRESGSVIKILEYAAPTLIGTLDSYKDSWYVTPDDKKFATVILIGPKDLNGARKGQIVLTEIVARGTVKNGFRHYGRIVEIIGYTGDPGIDIKSSLLSHGFTTEFPADVLKETEAIPEKPDARKYRGRRDLRGVRLFTIDGRDSKDLDDAVSIELLSGGADPASGEDPDGGAGISGGADPAGNEYPAGGEDQAAGAVPANRAIYKLGVHIADVAGYVKRGSALDAEALRRGTSLYYADRVAPMLPQKISNGICSLHPRVDRLALSVFMYIGADGRILKHEIFESVINSSHRLTYEEVWLMLDKRDPALLAEYADVADDLEEMRGLSDILREKRIRRGTLDFESAESEIKLDESGAPLSVEAAVTTFANRLIEEFMIACNETVAAHMTKAGLPFIYRTHAGPDAEKINHFIRLANNLGIKSGGIQEILLKSQDTNYKNLLSLLLLRSMAKAEYTPDNTGHYGLASDCYCHFTSPIRRYPDLMIQRIIKSYLKTGGVTRAERAGYEEILDGVCNKCSERERAADETERDIEAMKKAEYMKRFVGDEFDGTVTGITAFGMFVGLENTVEGLVRLYDMAGDYYIFNEDRYTLNGEYTGKIYRIGDAVKVALTRASPETRQIDFALVQTPEKKPDKKRRITYKNPSRPKKKPRR